MNLGECSESQPHHQQSSLITSGEAQHCTLQSTLESKTNYNMLCLADPGKARGCSRNSFFVRISFWLNNEPNRLAKAWTSYSRKFPFY